MPNTETATPPASDKALVGEVIAIGDELTTGQRLDTNTQWLAQRLTEQGIDVRYHTTVADDMAANLQVFKAAAERAQVVVATGGLGPTADDLTRDAMAEAAGVPLIDDPELASHIEAIFTSRGRQMPPQNLRQAQLPEGAVAINNPGGTAPGIDQTVGRCRFFALPGVPAEMREMWAETVEPAIRAMAGPRRVVRHWLVRCFGAGESHMESLLPDMIARGREPLVGITASHGTITLRVTASGIDEAACYEAMKPTLKEVRTTLGDLIFAEQPGGEPDIELQHVVLSLLKSWGMTLSTHELMTRGTLGQWLAEADTDPGHGESGFVSGSYTAPGLTIEEAVSDRLSDADCWILIASGGDGVVPITIGTPKGTVSKEITLVGHPSIHRPLVAKHALNLLRLELLKE